MESLLAQSEESKAFVKELCFEYAREAASLWYLREQVVCAPHAGLSGLGELESRIEAQIDGLRVAGETGWVACMEQLRRGFPEDYFVPAVLAFESGDESRIQFMLEKAALPDVDGVLALALGWLPRTQAEAHIATLLTSEDTLRRRIGIAASAFHRRDPEHHLSAAVYSGDARLKVRGLLAIGELGVNRFELSARLQNAFADSDPDVRFAAAWSAAMLGEARASDILASFAIPSSPYADRAIRVLLPRLDGKAASACHERLERAPGAERLAIAAAGVIGDPAFIPRLLEHMRTPALARAAGEAFTMITGVDIAEDLQGVRPEGFESGPGDDPGDDNVALDPDEYLPWPDAQHISSWWEASKTAFKPGERLFLGKPVTEEHLNRVLQTGRQRQRAAAALELTLLKPGRPLYNVYAPARRQLPEEKQAPVAAAPPNYGKRPLAITAANSITPVGHNAAMTAAAVRAGITRFAVSGDYKDQYGKPIVVSEIRGIRDEVADVVERISYIAEICLTDLLNVYFEKTIARPSQIRLFLGVAPDNRPGPKYGEESMFVLKHIMEKRLGGYAGEIISRGNASFHHALGEAAKAIQSKPDTLCIIGCVESLHRESILDWFEGEGRLKSASYGRNQGLIASEAVSFLIVSDLERARQAGRTILARISTLGLSEEPNPRASATSGIYKGLTEACHAAALEPMKEQAIHTILSDLNGEDARAREWGVTRIRCFPGDQKQPDLCNPAEYYGDIGAASGAVMAGIVAEGFKKNWLSSPVMIICSDDHGPCGAMVLEKDNLP